MWVSLKYRIAIIIFTLEVIMMSMVLWQTLSHSEEATRQQLHANEQVLLNVLRGISRVALLTEEYAELQPYLEDMLKNPRIEHVMLADVKGRVVASTQASDIGMETPDFTGQAVGLDSGSDERYWRTRSISNAEGTLGLLAVEFSNTRLYKAISAARNLGVSIAVIGMFIIAIVGLAVGIALTRRLELVSKAAGRFAQGDLDVRTGMKGRDEIGGMGQTFDNMAVAIKKHRHHLEELVAERTAALEVSNKELAAFSYSVSHDLRAPLRGIDGFSQILLNDYSELLDEEGKAYLQRIRKGTQRMGALIDDMLTLSRTSQARLEHKMVDMSELAKKTMIELQESMPDRKVEARIKDGLTISGDPKLMRIALDNLLGNAWKYTQKKDNAVIEFGLREKDGKSIFFVKDNGAGFDMRHADKLFGVFQRLHKAGEYEGTGIGLATVQRIIHRHGGDIWAESEVEKGAIFFFTMPVHSRNIKQEVV